MQMRHSTRILVNKGISFRLSTHYPYISAGNDTQNTLILGGTDTQIPLYLSHFWILNTLMAFPGFGTQYPYSITILGFEIPLFYIPIWVLKTLINKISTWIGHTANKDENGMVTALSPSFAFESGNHFIFFSGCKCIQHMTCWIGSRNF